MVEEGSTRGNRYRIYVLGRTWIKSAEWKEFADDSEAVAYLKSKLGVEPLEMWQGKRLVLRLKPMFGSPLLHWWKKRIGA